MCLGMLASKGHETYFVYFCRARFEPLELSLPWFVGLIIDYKLCRLLSLHLNWLLAVDEVDRKPLWIFNCHDIATAWSCFHALNAFGQDLGSRDFSHSSLRERSDFVEDQDFGLMGGVRLLRKILVAFYFE